MHTQAHPLALFYQLREFLAHVRRVSGKMARICWERGGKTGTLGEITEVVSKEGEVIKNETARPNDADSIAWQAPSQESFNHAFIIKEDSTRTACAWCAVCWCSPKSMQRGIIITVSSGKLVCLEESWVYRPYKIHVIKGLMWEF